MNTINSNNNTTVTVNNVFACAIYSYGMLVGHVEMTNTEIVRFNSENRGELYAKALLNRKEAK